MSSTRRSSRPQAQAVGSGDASESIARTGHDVVEIDIDTLTPHPRNYRAHPQDQIDHLVKSIQEHGFYRPVVLSSDLTILAGHGIVQAAKQAGIARIPAIVMPLQSDDAKALKILTGDNELSRLADIDDRMLSEILKDIKDIDELLGTGFNASTLAGLVMVTRPASEINDINEAAEWVGLPQYEPQSDPLKLVVAFDSEQDREDFLTLAGIRNVRNKNGRTWSVAWPDRDREDISSLRFSETADE